MTFLRALQRGNSMIRNLTLVALFVGSIVTANYATSELGMVAAGFGLVVTAGTYFAGLALGLRDALQESAGKGWMIVAIILGSAVSYVVADPVIALASGVAFGVSELADFAVYTPLRRKGWRRAVAASAVAGAVVDTLLFLSLAGFPVTAESVGGQMLVKAVWCTAGFLIVAEVVRRVVPRKPQYASGSSGDGAR